MKYFIILILLISTIGCESGSDSGGSYTIFTGGGVDTSGSSGGSSGGSGSNGSSATANDAIGCNTPPCGIPAAISEGSNFTSSDLSSGTVPTPSDETDIYNGTYPIVKGTRYVTSIKIGDVTGDGNLDAVVFGRTMFPQYYVGNGSGGFASGVEFGPECYDNGTCTKTGGDDIQNTDLNKGSTFPYLDLADVDKDGDLDVLTSSHGRHQMIYFNNGSGQFTQHFLLETPLNSVDAAFVDINNDSYPDIVVAVDDASSRFYINNQDQTFTAQNVPDSLQATDVEVADIDGDGDVDVAFVVGTEAHVYLNNGTSNTVALTKISSTPSLRSTDCIIKFIDAREGSTGDLDLLVGCENSLDYFVFASGDYGTATNSITSSQQINAVTVVDIDADGKHDILVAGVHHWSNSSKPAIFFGDDSADKFSSAYNFADGNSYVAAPEVDDSNDSIAVADFDGDGDTEIFAAGKNSDADPIIAFISN